MEVVRLTHRGIACLLPASQVVRASEERPSDPPILLWDGLGRSEHERRLVVRTQSGEHWLECSTPELTELPAGGAHPLSELLRGALELPHLVGWTMLHEDLVWLVDLMRWSKPQGNRE